MNRNDAAKVVSTSGWLSGRPEGFQLELLRRARLRRFDGGQTIYFAGDPPTGVFGLVDGVLEVRLPGRQVASVKSAGYWFGEAAAFSMTHRIGTIVAAVRSHLFHLPQAEFNQMIANADYCRYFAILTAEHLDEAAAIIEQLMLADPQARVASRLLTLAYHQGGADKAPLRVTQNELASMCALARQTINKVVKRFVRLGIVQSRYGRLTILDLDDLSSVAHGSDP